MDSVRIVSLFAGCGGLDIGFKRPGYSFTYACDSDAAAVDCYSRNIDSTVYQRDVRSEEFKSDLNNIGQCELILGGFPCQGFSKAGPKNESDSRNSLYREMKEAVARLQPTAFIAENVDGISQNFGGDFVKRILRDFVEVGYDVEYRILDASYFGVAQFRRRIFFVGVRQGNHDRFEWPTPTHSSWSRNGEFKVKNHLPLFDDETEPELSSPLTIRDVVSDLVELDNGVPDHQVTGRWPKKYNAIIEAIGEGQKLCNVRHSDTSIYSWDIPEAFGRVSKRERNILETIAKHRRHKRYGTIPNGNPLPTDEIERLSGLSDIYSEIEALEERGYLKNKDGKFDLKGAMFCSGLFKRPLWDEPSPTVLTNFYNPRYFLHPQENRPFSLRECARIQGFPDSFTFLDQNVDLVAGYRLVGNAVAPPLATRLADSMDKLFRLGKKRTRKYETTASLA